MHFSTTASNKPGSGTLVCECSGNRAQFSRIHAQYPLKFVPTGAHANRLGAVYMLSYGGGIVSGDHFDIVVRVGPQAKLLLMTQGNTKIFKDIQRRLGLPPSSEQIIANYIAADATLMLLPDPVTSFKLSSFCSRQTFHLASGATSKLVLLDWFNSGRITRGESWLFQHYSSRIDVFVEGKLVLRDHMALDDKTKDHKGNSQPMPAPLTSYAGQLGPYTCFATLIIVGVPESIEKLERMTEEQRFMASTQHRPLLWSTSPFLKGRGMLVRVAGMTTEQVRDFVKYECLQEGLKPIVGDGMFSKVLI